MLRSASAPAGQLDSVRFCALFEQFVEDLGDSCLPQGVATFRLESVTHSA